MAKTINELKHEYAQQQGFNSFYDLLNQWIKDGKIDWVERIHDEICKKFANSKLEEAAEQCEYIVLVECEIIDKQSILNLRDEV